MSVVWESVHVDDLDVVTNKKGEPVTPMHRVRLVAINQKKVEARALAMIMESINPPQTIMFKAGE